jgi:hypothetical protein
MSDDIVLANPKYFWPLLFFYILLSPLILLLKLCEEVIYLFAYLFGFVANMAEGHSRQEAHIKAREDVVSMRLGAKYGGQ